LILNSISDFKIVIAITIAIEKLIRINRGPIVIPDPDPGYCSKSHSWMFSAKQILHIRQELITDPRE